MTKHKKFIQIIPYGETLAALDDEGYVYYFDHLVESWVRFPGR